LEYILYCLFLVQVPLFSMHSVMRWWNSCSVQCILFIDCCSIWSVVLVDYYILRCCCWLLLGDCCLPLPHLRCCSLLRYGAHDRNWVRWTLRLFWILITVTLNSLPFTFADTIRCCWCSVITFTVTTAPPDYRPPTCDVCLPYVTCYLFLRWPRYCSFVDLRFITIVVLHTRVYEFYILRLRAPTRVCWNGNASLIVRWWICSVLPCSTVWNHWPVMVVLFCSVQGDCSFRYRCWLPPAFVHPLRFWVLFS